MTTLNGLCLGMCAAVVTLSPAIALAQDEVDRVPMGGGSGLSSIVRERAAELRVGVVADRRVGADGETPQVTRGARIRRYAVNVGVGAGVGFLFGELVLGRLLDMEHGPDMVIGMAIGAGVGALLTWVADRRDSRTATSPKRQGITFASNVRLSNGR